MERKLTRRAVLARGLQLPVAGGVLFGLTACGEQSGSSLVCASPTEMSSAQESVRRTLNYVEISPHTDKTCSGCDFFKAASAPGGCGSCEIFSGESANPGGHCDSWSSDS